MMKQFPIIEKQHADTKALSLDEGAFWLKSLEESFPLENRLNLATST
jgi:hypothetical protein